MENLFNVQGNLVVAIQVVLIQVEVNLLLM